MLCLLPKLIHNLLQNLILNLFLIRCYMFHLTQKHFHYFNFIRQFMNAIEKAPGAQQMGVLCVRRCNNTTTQIPGLQTGGKLRMGQGAVTCVLSEHVDTGHW